MDNSIDDQNRIVTVNPEYHYRSKETLALQNQDGTINTEKKLQDKKTVAELVRKSNRILTTISSHKLPYDFFPDSITIEEGRLTVITRNFFFNSRVHSIDIKNVSNIFINIAPLFAQLVIVSKTFIENEIKIKCLRKKEAVFARRIIEGLRIFADKDIDTSNYTKEELLAKLSELSTTKIVT